MLEKLKLTSSMKIYKTSRTNTYPPPPSPPKNVLFIIGDWNAEVGSQEKLKITDEFGLRVQNEAGQRLKNFIKSTFRS